MANSSRLRSPSPPKGAERPSVDDLLDQDVPATVVCAKCGNAECPGCKNHDLSRSGIVTIIPWERQWGERPGARLARLWDTARATTRDPEAFFELLPDGPIAPALAFAMLTELIAASAAVFSFVPIAAIIAPGWLRHVFLDEAARNFALRLLVLGIPALAIVLIAAHVVHGLFLDRGARASGAPAAASRALRFGLYATGWDLVIGPFGAVVVAIREGMAAALTVPSLAVGLPTRSARAFLRGCYRLDGEHADKALIASYIGASIATIFAAIACLAAVFAIALS